VEAKENPQADLHPPRLSSIREGPEVDDEDDEEVEELDPEDEELDPEDEELDPEDEEVVDDDLEELDVVDEPDVEDIVEEVKEAAWEEEVEEVVWELDDDADVVAPWTVEDVDIDTLVVLWLVAVPAPVLDEGGFEVPVEVAT
jgi:hypothetical protein